MYLSRRQRISERLSRSNLLVSGGDLLSRRSARMFFGDAQKHILCTTTLRTLSVTPGDFESGKTLELWCRPRLYCRKCSRSRTRALGARLPVPQKSKVGTGSRRQPGTMRTLASEKLSLDVSEAGSQLILKLRNGLRRLVRAGTTDFGLLNERPS